MDYPELDLLFGLILIFTLLLSIGLRVLLSKWDLPPWMSVLSWGALALSLLSTLYIEILFLQQMTPAFNRKIGVGFLVIGILVTLVTAFFYRREALPRAMGFVFGAQMLASLICLLLAYGLYRSLLPMSWI